MSEPMLISPMLDNFLMGDPISDRNGVRCCPAMNQETGKKYLVKIISSPASAAQLDALLLTGAYDSKEQALEYYKDVANGILDEVQILKNLSDLEGFMAFDDSQLVPMDDGNGFDVYLLGSYKMTLAKFFNREPMTHLNALNLGLDLCSALTVCRKSGYLYVNLKPENVYLTTDNGFRIGDLGFVRLDSLKYTSLPDRYRSDYTAPEIDDAFATLSATADVYAVGLILYRAFNGGQLPNIETGKALSAPDYADYEMAEIILKACDPDPEKRWEDPAQMGHALVDYMQRNGAHDTPIVPPAAAVEDEQESIIVEETEVIEDSTDSETVEEAVDTETSTVSAFIPDDEDETQPGMDEDDLVMEDMSEEISDILNQADELLSHPTPDPVVAPDPVEVTLPEIVEEVETTEEQVAEETAEGSTEAQETDEYSPTVEACDEEAPSEDTVVETEDSSEDEEEYYKPKSHWLRYCLIGLIILALLAGAFAVYKFYYIQDVDMLLCEGDGTTLTVYIETEADQKLLTAICTDTYGNRLTAPVNNGMAHFEGLTPDSPYTVKLEISGFHGLSGETSVSYKTPQQTEITSFTAVVGNEPGSAVLKFTVDGPDETTWMVKYFDNTKNEATAIECTDHMATVEGLTLGTEYTFELYPVDEINYVGETTVSHLASKPVVAENLYVSDLKDGTMTVKWLAPKQTTVSDWTVRCYNDEGFELSDNTTDTAYTFEGITEGGKYTIEVTAAGMLTAQRINVNTGATPISNIVITITDDNRTQLTWECDDDTVDGDWYVEYTVDSTVKQTVTGTSETSLTLDPMIPNARYQFTIGNGDTEFFGNVTVHTTGEAENFDNYYVTNEHVTLNMCYTPDYEEWDIYYLEDDEFSTTFKPGESASFAVTLEKTYERSWDDIVTHIVIRDGSQRILAVATTESAWRNMWSYGEGALDLPALPVEPGEYTATVYFNGAYAASQTFTITS